MIQHYCDKCGRKMIRWYTVSIGVDAVHPWANIADMLNQCKKLEYCEECFEPFYMPKEE